MRHHGQFSWEWFPRPEKHNEISSTPRITAEDNFGLQSLIKYLFMNTIKHSMTCDLITLNIYKQSPPFGVKIFFWPHVCWLIMFMFERLSKKRIFGREVKLSGQMWILVISVYWLLCLLIISLIIKIYLQVHCINMYLEVRLCQTTGCIIH